MRHEVRAVIVLGMAIGCAAPSSRTQAQTVVICPAGSILDPQKQLCVAMEPTKPVDVDQGSDVVVASTATTRLAATTSAVVAPPPPPPPPPTSGFAVDVQCSFSQGWVS